MTDHHLVRRSLEEALDLARHSRVNEAIARLEEGLNEARKRRDAEAASSLARHAGLLSFAVGNNRQAVSYYREALATEPEDAYLHLALAEAYISLGHADSVLTSLRRALELATEADDGELAEMVSKKLDDYIEDGHRQ